MDWLSLFPKEPVLSLEYQEVIANDLKEHLIHEQLLMLEDYVKNSIKIMVSVLLKKEKKEHKMIHVWRVSEYVKHVFLCLLKKKNTI